ncbi:MAG: hypothetical protein PVJ75_08990 [Chloroflexota bacterium]|jgi:hypothetical protein
MDALTSGSMAFDDNQDATDATPSEMSEQWATPGGGREVKWEVVTKTPGLAPAEIIAQRLRTEGIPARAWQEGAGQAFGLTIGLLGNGYVIVPDSYLEQAKAILAESAEEDASLFDEDE